ncbi:MAG: sigma-70 family RNA polymerase sigma factor [Lysobacteraceae bacterium]
MIVASAGSDGASQDALEKLCRFYRAPVLAFLRGKGMTVDEAEDLTQSFFAHLLSQRLHESADPAKGSFRAFLLSALKHFVISERRRVTAEKRGGGALHVPLESVAEPLGDETPEMIFEREWAHTIVAHAVKQLQGEAREAGKHTLFNALREFLFESPSVDDYARVSQQFGLSRNTVAVAVHRLRHRLHMLVTAQVSQTLSDPAQVPAEVKTIQGWLIKPPRAPVRQM